MPGFVSGTRNISVNFLNVLKKEKKVWIFMWFPVACLQCVLQLLFKLDSVGFFYLYPKGAFYKSDTVIRGYHP